MGPVQQLSPITITPADLCILAVDYCSVRVSRQEVLTALGAISNLYCLYALDKGETVYTVFQEFTAPHVAPRRAVLGEIRRALHGASFEMPEAILTALGKALDEAFRKRECAQVKLSGFGLLRQSEGASSEYQLQVELPMAEFLRNGSNGLNRTAGAAGD